MVSALSEAVAAVLARAGKPLDPAGIAARLPPPLGAAGPAEIGKAARDHPACLSVRRGWYVHLPTAASGATVFMARPPAVRTRPIVLPVEAIALLWPGWPRIEPGAARPATIEQRDGGRIRLELRRVAQDFAMYDDGCTERPGDGWLLHCLDGVAGRYALAPCSGPAADGAEARWLEAAVRALQPKHPCDPRDLAMRTLASGAYHLDPPRTSLADLTGRPPFLRDHYVTFRPDLTPQLWSLFAARLPGPRPVRPVLPPPLVREARYRIRARLQAGPWWVEIEAGAEHTLDEVHWALHAALRWDTDHLHAFYLSGTHHDYLTQVMCADAAEADDPATSEVSLGHFDPHPGASFAYVFDFGDDWRFVFHVLERIEGAAGLRDVRRLAVSGRAPQQYPE